jgi:surfeit locus 1 family protein
VLAHLALVVVVAACVSLGLWQLRRLDARRAYESLVAERSAAPPVSLADLAPDPRTVDPDAVAYRRVVVEGMFDPDHEVVLLGRALEGRPGNHVLTPLLLEDGSALVVDRGWVPYELRSPPVGQAPPPAGEVVVEGVVLPPSPDRSSGGDPTLVTAIDLETIGERVDVPLLPFALLLQEVDPASPAELPIVVAPPGPEEGPPHLSYAVQWFSFAAIAVIGYAILVRRELRSAPSPPGTTSPR